MKRKIRNIFLAISLSVCISCESDPGPSALEGFAFIIAMENVIGNYLPPALCTDPSRTTTLLVNTPITYSGATLIDSPFYLYDPGDNPLNYEFTVSSDYPNCGVRLAIYSCTPPNNALVEASDGIVSCDSGTTYSTYADGGTQTCSIPTFANNKAIVFLTKYTSSFSNACSDITFEAKP